MSHEEVYVPQIANFLRLFNGCKNAHRGNNKKRMAEPSKAILNLKYVMSGKVVICLHEIYLKSLQNLIKGLSLIFPLRKGFNENEES